MTKLETPETYIAFRGSHHGGTWSVVVSEGLDMILSGLEGVVMMYLLAVAFCQFLVGRSNAHARSMAFVNVYCNLHTRQQNRHRSLTIL